MPSWEKNVRFVTPYTPGEQPKITGVIKLNTNENPYPPAPEAVEALHTLPGDLLRLYPDPAISDLRNALADFYHLSPEEVFVGVGSDDVLAQIFLTFFNSGKPVLFPDITYSFYDVWAELFRIPFRRIPLDSAFGIRREDYFADNGGIVLANPNAPTGNVMPLSEIGEIIEKNPGQIVVVDEAYVDFGAESALPLIEKYDNLLVVQTFSKSRSLAGMRIGYCMGNPLLIRCLSDVKYSYNSYTLSRAAIAAGCAAVKNRAYFEECCRKIISTREWTKKELSSLGFSFPDSKANFIFARHETRSASWIFEELKKRKVFVRYWNKERIDQYLRITIGTPEEMQTLINTLKEIL